MLLILQILIVGTVVVPGLSCPLSVKVYDSSSKLASVAMEEERVGEGRRERESKKGRRGKERKEGEEGKGEKGGGGGGGFIGGMDKEGWREEGR